MVLVFLPVDYFQVFDDGFGVSFDQVIFRRGLHVNANLSFFDIEFGIGLKEIVEIGDVEAQHFGFGVENRDLAQDIQFHVEAGVSPIDGGRSFGGGGKQFLVVLGVGQVLGEDMHVFGEDIDFGIAVIIPVVDLSVVDFQPVDLQRHQFFDHVGPAGIDLGLGAGFGGAFYKIQHGVSDFDLSVDGPMEQRLPFEGMVYGVGREERDGNLTVCPFEVGIFEDIGSPDEGYVDVIHMAGVSGNMGEFVIDQFQQDIGQGDAEGDEQDNERAQDYVNNLPFFCEGAVFFG